MQKQRFFCIDAHTCGNPVRLIASGGPILEGNNMMEKRNDFIKNHDWIRKSLMFEPRGHDMMSGSILYAPCNPNNDVAILFIETSGCLPMCGHGTIGTITIAIEEGLLKPKNQGKLKVEVPAGLLEIEYEQAENGKVASVSITNIPSFLFKTGIEITCPDLGVLYVDVAYGGNFYAIIDIQNNFSGIQNYSAAQLIVWSQSIRTAINNKETFKHPHFTDINVCSHVLWAGSVIDKKATARNAVFYGDKAIDRSPCGTGTSARMAQWYAKGMLKENEPFIHESIIGSTFVGTIIGETNVGSYTAIIPKISGWAKIYGYNNILVDANDDPYAAGFQVI